MIEPSPGVFNWSHYDIVFGAAGARGLRILPLLTDTPSWAGPSEAAVPTDPTAYADFVAHVVARYGPHGTFWAANPQWAASASDTFELWNEPYYADYNPGNYARLVKAATTAGRAADPSAKFLLAAEVYGSGSGASFVSWVDALYAAVPDLNNYFDDVAMHPYGKDVTGLSGDGENQLRRIEMLRAQFVAHGASDKGFWLTEVGYSTCGTVETQCVTPAQQASEMQTMFTDMKTTYSSFVRAVFVYRYNDLAATASMQNDYGLTTVDGTAKPALAVLQANAASV
jgi:polysaccharide biosynthesis protein PslG